MNFKIIYEDNHLIAVHKEAGTPVQPDSSKDLSLIDDVKKFLVRKYNKKGDAYLGLIHRLDRPVSGLILLAKTSKAMIRMSEQFRDRKVTKTYLALCRTRPDIETKTLKNYLYKNKSMNRVLVHDQTKKGSKLAITKYDLVGEFENKYVLKVQPETGRSHQIRVQLAHDGLPIIGDLKYKGKIHENPKLIMLHSYRLEFLHPTTKEKMNIFAIPRSVEWKRYLHLISEE